MSKLLRHYSDSTIPSTLCSATFSVSGKIASRAFSFSSAPFYPSLPRPLANEPITFWFHLSRALPLSRSRGSLRTATRIEHHARQHMILTRISALKCMQENVTQRRDGKFAGSNQHHNATQCARQRRQTFRGRDREKILQIVFSQVRACFPCRPERRVR